MSDPGAILKRACDLILADTTLQPEYDAAGKLQKTHCNQGVRLVAEAMGCHELDPKEDTADVMLGIMVANASKRWRKASGQEATIHALTGCLAVAGLTAAALGELHGHVCVVYPVGMQPSRSVGHDVPMLANVGAGNPASALEDVKGRPGVRTRNNWLCKVSEAFPCKRLGREPDYMLFS